MLLVRRLTFFLVFEDLVYALTFLVLLIFAVSPALWYGWQLLRQQRGADSEQAGNDDQSLHGDRFFYNVNVDKKWP
jgi:hypothetical protein